MSNEISPANGWQISSETAIVDGRRLLRLEVLFPAPGSAGAECLGARVACLEDGLKGSVLAHVRRCVARRNRCFPTNPAAQALEHAAAIRDATLEAASAYRHRLTRAVVAHAAREIADAAEAVLLADLLDADPQWAVSVAELVISMIDPDLFSGDLP